MFKELFLDVILSFPSYFSMNYKRCLGKQSLVKCKIHLFEYGYDPFVSYHQGLEKFQAILPKAMSKHKTYHYYLIAKADPPLHMVCWAGQQLHKSPPPMWSWVWWEETSWNPRNESLRMMVGDHIIFPFLFQSHTNILFINSLSKYWFQQENIYKIPQFFRLSWTVFTIS